MRIGEARPDDAPALAALLADLGYPVSAAPLPGRLRAFADDPGSFVPVAVEAGRVLGLAAATILPLLHEDRSWCRLSALVVGADRRRAGIGRRLVPATSR